MKKILKSIDTYFTNEIIDKLMSISDISDFIDGKLILSVNFLTILTEKSVVIIKKSVGYIFINFQLNPSMMNLYQGLM